MIEQSFHVQPVLALIAVFACAWIALRWGPIIFSAYALFYCCTEQWIGVFLALGFALFLQLTSALARGVSRKLG